MEAFNTFYRRVGWLARRVSRILGQELIAVTYMYFIASYTNGFEAIRNVYLIVK